jgi:hypothetical protein
MPLRTALVIAGGPVSVALGPTISLEHASKSINRFTSLLSHSLDDSNRLFVGFKVGVIVTLW